MISFRIQVPSDYPVTSLVGVQETGELPEYGQVWVWDMLYAQTVHALATGSEADRRVGDLMKEVIDVWAVNMSSKIHQPIEHVRSKGHTDLHPELRIGEPAGATREVILNVAGGAKEMPSVTAVYPADADAQLKATTVLALAQYFIDRNELFAKELPLHVLAFRKYHADVREPSEPESVEEGPLYAIQKALEYFNSVAQGTMQ